MILKDRQQTYPEDQALSSYLAGLHFTNHGHAPKNGVNTIQLLPGLLLCARLKVLDCLRHIALARQELQPHVPAAVIHEQEEVSPPTMRHRRDRPAKVPVDGS